ncbi:MAG: hypothetical protein KME60_07075 [Cyanomargarita calcarea GSE-NOS-MK-12-04C]|jgi:hypothetical protein|uniref:Uncharacterized protein n=1 Tax=Cyanomargarita calcarea GSE-NOS-MK-12-04C TaxID=2839659 RepID=A0A951USF4_9CYAN|nr:hypothetical protein [Cyanomargarita calcarea GSE-NOS-MK-12-04C]
MPGSDIGIAEFIAIFLIAIVALSRVRVATKKGPGEYSTEKKIALIVNIRKRTVMKVNTNTLASIFGSIAGVAQVLGQTGVISKDVATSVSAIAVVLLGFVTNNVPTTNQSQGK